MVSEAVAARRPSRGPETHKGSAGRVLIVGGSPGLTGAMTLAASAAIRFGAGYVTCAVPAPLLASFEGRPTEAVKRPLPADRSGTLSEAAAKEIESLAADAHAVLLGPGLGGGRGIEKLVARLTSRLRVPLVLDADALNSLRLPASAKPGSRPWILTPHPGEAGRLLSKTTDAVQSDRFAAAREIARRSGGVAVLKGARTVVTAGDAVFLNPTGGPALATAGTGDVLAGILAALVAQGLPPLDAAIVGPFWHGEAGDRAAAALTPLSPSASDLLHPPHFQIVKT